MKLSVALKARSKQIVKGISEEFRETSIYQDIMRLLILIIHIYFYYLIFRLMNLSIRLIFMLTLETFTINLFYFLFSSLNGILNKIYNKNLYKKTDIYFDEDNSGDEDGDSKQNNKETNKEDKDDNQKFSKISRNHFYIIQQCKLNTLYRLGFTASVVVSIMYWGIYLNNPKMLGENHLPLYFDCFIHGGTLVLMAFDRLVIDRRHRYEIRIRSRVLLLITIFYFAMIYTVFLVSGVAVYPLLAKLGFIQLIILTGIGYILFLIGNFIYLLMM